MTTSLKLVLSLSVLFIAVGIGLGAVGAHILKPILTSKDFEIYHTAVFYHLFNALGALAIISLTPAHITADRAHKIVLCLLTGIIIFSGSLYLLVATNVRVLGAITPFGGVLMIISWVWLALSALSPKIK